MIDLIRACNPGKQRQTEQAISMARSGLVEKLTDPDRLLERSGFELIKTEEEKKKEEAERKRQQGGGAGASEEGRAAEPAAEGAAAP